MSAESVNYPTTTVTKRVGACGSIHLLFQEDEGAFHKVVIMGDIEKIPCGKCWLEAMGRILTYALRRAIWEGTAEIGIVEQLLNIRCNELPPNKERICSCADAIGKAVKQYLRGEYEKKTGG
jgi:hypothetical protein